MLLSGINLQQNKWRNAAHQDEQLAQTFGTKGTETIGDKLADSTRIADKYGVENEKSTQDTDSEVSKWHRHLLQICPR